MTVETEKFRIKAKLKGKLKKYFQISPVAAPKHLNRYLLY